MEKSPAVSVVDCQVSTVLRQKLAVETYFAEFSCFELLLLLFRLVVPFLAIEVHEIELLDQTLSGDADPPSSQFLHRGPGQRRIGVPSL
jgi:hypothetical protein